MPSQLSKYRASPAPDFSKTNPNSTLDTFFGLKSQSKLENASIQIYNPNYDYMYLTTSSKVANFEKAISRDKRQDLEKKDLSLPPEQHPYDSIKMTQALDNLS